MLSLFFATLFLVSVLADRACNNSPSLCSKPYDAITHLGAHDSPFLRDASTSYSSFGNQFFNTTVQLSAGVRLLSAQIHIDANDITRQRELHICHTSCKLFDAGLLRDWLWEIRIWMDKNPDEVVTLLFVNAGVVDAREIEGEYSRADIAHYGYIPPSITNAPRPSNETHQTWPTLGQMIDKGERLVTFVNPLVPDKETAPYLLDEFTFLWENSYEVTDPGNFTCQPDRPQGQTITGMRESGRLFLMNHFLYWQQAFNIQVPDARNVNNTNSWDREGGLGKHMLVCAEQITRQPTFVLVDFFNVGPAIDSVDIFNGMDNPVGRLNVSNEVFDSHMRQQFSGKAGRQVYV